MLVTRVLLLGTFLAFAYAGGLAILRLPIFPVRELIIVTPLRQVTPAQIEYAAADSVTGNFFTISPERIRQAFEKLPWVRHATVRRQWPDTLEIQLEEHLAAAQWQESGADDLVLMNIQGELFTAASHEPLPYLSGPPGRATDVLARYREFSGIVSPLKLRLTSVTLSSREAWTLRLSGDKQPGLTVELGRDQSQASLTQRLSRFAAAYRETVAQLKAPMATADVRYPNGFAVRLATKDAKEK